MRGRAHLERRDIKKAEAAYNKADALRPDYAPILLGRVKIHLRRGEFDSAETLADRALVLAPEDAEVWYYKGEVDRLKGNVKPALQYYNKSIEYEAGHLQSRLARAAMYIEMGRPEDARQDLKLVRTIVPGDQRAAFLFALILANDEDVEGAQSILEKSSTAIETADPNFMNDPSSLLLSGFISYARKDYSKAYTYLHRYITLIPHHPGARKLLGAILLRWNDALGAIEYLTPALRLSSEDPQLLVLLGTAYMRAKNFNDATKWFAKAASIAPDKASIRMQLAIGRLATGKIKKGLEDLESALTLDAGKSSVSVTLGMIHLRARNYDKALLIARSLIKQDDQNALAYNLAGTAMAGKRDYAAARANLERAMVIDPTFTQAQSNLAELNRAEGKREAEKQIYQQIAKREPGNTIAMIRLSRIAQIEERNSVAIKWLAKARAVNPNLLKPQLRLIGLYLRERQIPKAFEVALDLTSRNPDNVTVLEALGRVEVAAGQITRAILTFNKIAKLVENSSRGLFLASKLLLFVKDFVGARRSLESAVKLNPDFLPAQVAMVDLDVRQGKINKALQRAEALRNSRPNSTIGDIIAGDTLMRAHRPAEALEAYKVAFKRAPNSHIVARLFKAHRAVSSVTAALPHLAGWVASHPEDIQSRRLLASAYGDLGKTKIAIQHSEIILRKLPNDAAILNNLALLYQSTNDSRSLAYAERAFKHAPKHPATLDSLGWVLVQRGDMARGLKFLRMAYNRASREPEIQYHLGVALSRMGRLNEARNQLKSALKSGKFFQGKSDARDLLKSLSEK